MKVTLTNEDKKHVDKLVEKAVQAREAHEAMQYSQAALNAANALFNVALGMTSN